MCGSGATDLSEEGVRQALARAQALRFVERLPSGLAQQVSERGANLSSGQRQLLSFARALAYDPKILVMDEATSSVDSETERLIQIALNELLAERTALVIAHRLSTIERADRIMVLAGGVLRESGTHEELLKHARTLLSALRTAVRGDGHGTLRARPWTETCDAACAGSLHSRRQRCCSPDATSDTSRAAHTKKARILWNRKPIPRSSPTPNSRPKSARGWKPFSPCAISRATISASKSATPTRRSRRSTKARSCTS